ncbi:MAG: hypothetical protein ACI8ZM_005243 [Crocinitomix sp.]|jgi:hypothetical protein
MIYPEAMRSYPPGSYQRYIHNNYIKDLGFDLTSIGKKLLTNKTPVNLQNEELVDLGTLRKSFKEVIDFLNSPSSTRYDNVVWYKMNLIDQVLNEFMGIGSFKLENDYLKFIQSYLSIERADQAGDTIIVLFDKDFNWAVEFTLNQEDEFLTAAIYDSGDRKPKIIDHAK